MKIALILLLLTSSVAYAGSSVAKNWAMPLPPTDLKEPSLYGYLYFLYSHFNQAQIVTTSPNGSLPGSAGDFVIYNNSGTHQICFETAQPRGTTWKCANLT